MAHCNTILSRILKFIPRHEFETLANQHHSGRALRTSSRWSQFVGLDAVTGKRYVFLTNNFKLSARTIADIYKARWQVELFFKWIKQNLKIRFFVGTNKFAQSSWCYGE